MTRLGRVCAQHESFASPSGKVPGEAIVRTRTETRLPLNFNRTQLLAMVKFSIASASPAPIQVTRTHPKIKIVVSAEVVWSARDDPLTISTNHTPLDPANNFIFHFVFKHGDQIVNGWPSQSLKIHFGFPTDGDFTDLNFATLPATSSVASHSVEQELDLQRVLDGMPVDGGSPVRFKLSPTWYNRAPAIYWRGWGTFENELRGKRLIAPYNLAQSIKDWEARGLKEIEGAVQPFDAALRPCDEEGNKFLYLEALFDDTELQFQLIDEL